MAFDGFDKAAYDREAALEERRLTQQSTQNLGRNIDPILEMKRQQLNQQKGEMLIHQQSEQPQEQQRPKPKSFAVRLALGIKDKITGTGPMAQQQAGKQSRFRKSKRRMTRNQQNIRYGGRKLSDSFYRPTYVEYNLASGKKEVKKGMLRLK